MTDTTEKPVNFNVKIWQGVAHVERNLEFEKDTIALKLQITPTDLGKTTVLDLHQQALQIAISHLQGLLDRSLAENPPKA